MNKKELFELNVSARELRREGKLTELRALAVSKGISEQAINDFIAGSSISMNEPESKEEITDVEVIVPFYKSIEEKLEQEQEDLLKTIKEEIQKKFIKSQLKIIVDFILADDDLKVKAFQDWKELSSCYKAMSNKARKYALNGVACISDDVVFGWIKEYYNLDDRKKVEEERKKKAIAEKKAEESKKKAESKKKTKSKSTTKAKDEAKGKAKDEKSNDATLENVEKSENSGSESGNMVNVNTVSNGTVNTTM